MDRMKSGRITITTAVFAATSSLMAVPAFAQEGIWVYAPNFGDNTLGVYASQADGTLASEAEIGGVGFTLLVSYVRADQAFAYVAARSSNTLSVIDTATQTVIQTVAAGTQPTGMVASPDGKTFYVANGSGGVSVFAADPVSGQLTSEATIATDNGLRNIAISPDGSRVYAVNQFTDRIEVIDTASKTLETQIAVGDQPLDVAVSPDGSKVYVSNFSDDSVSVIDAATNTVSATLSLDFGGTDGFGPDGLIVSDDGKFLYVANRSTGNITIIDADTNSAVGIVSSGSQTNSVALSPDGSKLYTTAQGASDSLKTYDIDPATGLLTFNDSVAAGNAPLSASICENGNSLLASGGIFVAKSGAALSCNRGSTEFTGGTLLLPVLTSNSAPA